MTTVLTNQNPGNSETLWDFMRLAKKYFHLKSNAVYNSSAKNHKVFGNASIITMVGKIILLLVNAKQVIKSCYNFRESSTILGYNKPWTCY